MIHGNHVHSLLDFIDPLLFQRGYHLQVLGVESDLLFVLIGVFLDDLNPLKLVDVVGCAYLFFGEFLTTLSQFTIDLGVFGLHLNDMFKILVGFEEVAQSEISLTSPVVGLDVIAL